MGKHSGFRTRLYRAIHAEASKRGIDHDGLRDICAMRCGAKRMSDMTDAQLHGLYRSWTGRELRQRAKLPRRGRDPLADGQMVASEEMIALEQEFAKAGWDEAAQKTFIRRQLKGRETVRTRGDWKRVLCGVRAINRRRSEEQ